MREIKIYSFNELSPSAQRKAIEKNIAEIGANARIYLKDIYNEELGILSELICRDTRSMFNIDVNDYSNSVTVMIPLAPVYDKANMNAEQVKEWLVDLKNKIYDEGFIDKVIVSKIIDKHYAKKYPTISAFLLDLGYDISVRATEFYGNMKTNPEFVMDYIAGRVPDEYYFIAQDDIFMDGDYEFYEDGTMYNED